MKTSGMATAKTSLWRSPSLLKNGRRQAGAETRRMNYPRPHLITRSISGLLFAEAEEPVAAKLALALSKRPMIHGLVKKVSWRWKASSTRRVSGRAICCHRVANCERGHGMARNRWENIYAWVWHGSDESFARGAGFPRFTPDSRETPGAVG